jgi:hypothetical protein
MSECLGTDARGVIALDPRASPRDLTLGPGCLLMGDRHVFGKIPPAVYQNWKVNLRIQPLFLGSSGKIPRTIFRVR